MVSCPECKIEIDEKSTVCPSCGAQTDWDLLNQFYHGYNQAYEQLIKRYYYKIFNFAYRTVGRREDAADITQETFLKLQKALPFLIKKKELNFAAYLYKMSYYLCMDLIYERKKFVARDSELFAAEEVTFYSSPVGTAELKEQVETVRNVISRIPERYRIVLNLRELSDCSYKEISQIIHTSRANVAQLLLRARERFRREYRMAHLEKSKLPSLCQKMIPLLSSYLDEDLSGSRKKYVEDHLENCQNCQNSLEQMRESSRTYRVLIPVIPPLALKHNIIEGIGTVAKFSAAEVAKITFLGKAISKISSFFRNLSFRLKENLPRLKIATTSERLFLAKNMFFLFPAAAIIIVGITAGTLILFGWQKPAQGIGQEIPTYVAGNFFQNAPTLTPLTTPMPSVTPSSSETNMPSETSYSSTGLGWETETTGGEGGESTGEAADKESPTGSIRINGGDGFTYMSNVTLYLTATDNGSGVAGMIVSNNPKFGDAQWESFKAVRPWFFFTGEGEKTIHVKYKDKEGNESQAYSARIILKMASAEYYDSFENETYKDSSNTNAYWDTGNGEIRLPGEWKALGDSSKIVSFGNELLESDNLASLALKSNPHPCLAYAGYSSGDWEIYYKYWDGSKWSNLGNQENVSQTPGNSYGPSLVLDGKGYPHLAWAQQDSMTGSVEIYYKYWNGSSWADLSGSPKVTNDNKKDWDPQLRLDSKGNPHISYTYTGTNNRTAIYYTYWDGSKWSNLGSNPDVSRSSENDAFGSSLSLDSSDYPHIAWSENKNTDNPFIGEIHYKYWNGSAWSTRGAEVISTSGLSSVYPSLALDSQNNPHLAWFEYPQGSSSPKERKIYYRFWNRSSWTNLGGNDSVTSGASFPSLSLDINNNPYISYSGYDNNSYVSLLVWGGQEWVSLGHASDGTNNSSFNYLLLDSQNNPYLGWEVDLDGDGYTEEFHYKYWNQTSLAYVQSKKVNKEDGQIKKAIVYMDDYLNNQSINYYLSNDGGNSWQSATSGTEVKFITKGNDLRWKAVLSTENKCLTPIISSITIEYSYFK